MGDFPAKHPHPPEKFLGGVGPRIKKETCRGAHHPSPSAGVLMNYPKKDLYWII